MKNPVLWEKLEAFAFDADTGTQPFSVKLAEVEGWDATFTARVIEEYRRFLYLAHVAEHEVTPSVAVDQAWHTHLTFTRSYWEDLCEGVLGAPFHHDPCKGSEDMPRYNEQYARTLALYNAEFGHVVPADIWPQPTDPPEAFTEPEPLQKWFATKGIVIGLCAGLPALVALMIFGVNLVTVMILVICGALIFAGILSFPGAKQRKKDHAGGGAFVGGCSGASKKSGAGDGAGDGGGAGCGGGGCGGGGG